MTDLTPCNRPIETGLNISHPEVQKVILKAVEAFGTPAQVKHVSTVLDTIDGIITVKLHELVFDSVICIISFLNITIKIPIQTLIGKLITRDVYGPERNRISTAYLNGLVRDAEYKVELEHVYKIWKKTRKFTIRRLKEIAIEIRKDRKNSNITGSVVSATAIVGGAAAIVLTGGLAAPAVAATAVSLAGVTTAVGADVVTHQLVKGGKKNANTIVEEDRQNTDNLIKLLERYKQQTQLHLASADGIDKVILRFKDMQQESIKVTFVIGNSVQEDIGYVKAIRKDVKIIEGKLSSVITLVMGGGEIISRVVGTIKTVGTFTDDAVLGSLRALSVGARVTLALGVAAFVVDIGTIVATAIRIAKGSPDKAAKMIQKAATDLENIKIPELNDIIIDTKVEAAKENRLYIEGFPG